MLKMFPIAVVAFVAVFAVSYSNAESCISCGSNDDLNCAQNPEILMAKGCPTQTSRCYTRIVDGQTIRGCSEELDEEVIKNCDDQHNCQICSGLNATPGCNNQIYPALRLTCHMCKDSANSPNCTEAILANPTPCKIYKEDDQCYIHKTAKTFERGCLSDAGLKCSNATQCLICTGNGCNSEHGSSSNIPIAPSSANMLAASIVCALIACLINMKTIF